MLSIESCLYCVQKCFGLGSGRNCSVATKEHITPNVILDTTNMGNDVVIVKNGHRICGTGAALSNAPIVQDKAYFEVTIQQNGIWGIGLATDSVNLNRVPAGSDSDAWVLRCDGTIVHSNETLYRLRDHELQDGDVVGITYDHTELKFYLNSQPVEYSVTGIKGQVLPILYVDDGAILDANFTAFKYRPPAGFDRILLEKSLL